MLLLLPVLGPHGKNLCFRVTVDSGWRESQGDHPKYLSQHCAVTTEAWSIFFLILLLDYLFRKQ